MEPHLATVVKATSRGRPCADNRAVLDGILWVLKSGAHAGAIYPSNIRRPAPVGDSCGSGKSKRYRLKSGVPFSLSSTRECGRPQQRRLRIIADRAYENDPPRLKLLQRGIVLICPHRGGRTKPLFNDGRTLRRYRKRWKIECTFTWLGNYRRLTVRYENHPLIQAFFHLACLLITLRYL